MIRFQCRDNTGSATSFWKCGKTQSVIAETMAVTCGQADTPFVRDLECYRC